MRAPQSFPSFQTTMNGREIMRYDAYQLDTVSRTMFCHTAHFLIWVMKAIYVNSVR